MPRILAHLFIYFHTSNLKNRRPITYLLFEVFFLKLVKTLRENFVLFLNHSAGIVSQDLRQNTMKTHQKAKKRSAPRVEKNKIRDVNHVMSKTWFPPVKSEQFSQD